MNGDFPYFITTNIWGEVFGGRAWLDLHLWAIHTFATCWDFFLRPKKRSCFCGFCLFFDVFYLFFFVWCVFFGVLLDFFFNQLTWNAMKRHVPCQLNMSQPTDLTLFVALLIVCYMRWPIIMLKFLWVKPKLHHQSMKFPGFTRCYFKETCNHFWKPASSLRHTWWDLP